MVSHFVQTTDGKKGIPEVRDFSPVVGTKVGATDGLFDGIDIGIGFGICVGMA